MNMRLNLLLFLGAIMMWPVAAFAEMQTLLSLTLLSDGKPVQQISLQGNTIDPNTSAVDDTFTLEISGENIDVPQPFLAQLAQSRREFSYDHFTGGISEQERQAICRLGGPSQGWLLETLYLTYKNHQIESSKLRPILTEPANCLFATQIQPVNQSAWFAAGKALAQLQTVLALKREGKIDETRQ